MLRRLLKYQTIQTGKGHTEFKSFKGMPNKKKREENFTQVTQNFVRLYMSQRFLHATVYVIYMFRPSFYNLLNMIFWMKTCPFRSSHQTIFFYTSALKS